MSETAPKHDLDGRESTARARRASVRVIETVAAAAGEDPLAMDPLYDVIDPDALDRLFTGDVEGHVQFTFCDHEVSVFSDGRVQVDGSEQEER